MAMAVLFGAVACSQNPVEEVVSNQEVTTKLTIGLENLGTRLAGDSGMINKVAWGVYNHKEDGTGEYLKAHSSEIAGVADFQNGSAEIEITLFTGKRYDLVFWGYCDDNTAYTIDWEHRALNVNYTGQKANVEANDAFFHIENGFRAGQNQTFTLRRPFAQLNVGQTYEDYNIMQLTGNSIVASSATAKAYTTMSLVDASVSNLVEVELLKNAVVAEDLTVAGANYKHLAMNYLLVNQKEVVNTVTFNFVENGEVADGNGTVFTRQYYNIPLQRNYRTNILGNIISDEYTFTIVIDERFCEPDNIIFDAFQYGGEVTLQENTEIAHTLYVRQGVNAVLNLNGKTLKNSVNNLHTDVIVIEQGATLTINGEGTVEAVSGNDGYAVVCQGTLIVNGGTFKAGVDENGEANAVLYARGEGEIYVNGGYFPNENNSAYVLNKRDADRATTVIEVKGGIFEGFNPADNAAENAGTNFVAAGYKAVQNGTKWYVIEENSTLVASADELKATIANNAVINLAAGTYEGVFDLSGVTGLTIKSDYGATINGIVWLNNSNVVLESLTLTNAVGAQHPNPTNSQYYTTINNQYPVIGAYLSSNVKCVNCVFNLVAPTNYGFYGYANNSPEFQGCTFNCNGIRPIANNGPSVVVNSCTFVDQYHYSVRIFENNGSVQDVVYTNNVVCGTNNKGEFEGVNISKKGGAATVVGNFTIKGNTADLKYRHHKQVTMSDACTYDTDIANFAFEREE